MAQLFYYYVDGSEQQQGPLLAEEVRELVRQGVITPMTPFRTDRMEFWGMAGDFEDVLPNYDPHQLTKPPGRPRRWGYRMTMSLLQNPVRIFGIVLVIGIVLELYRSLAVAWIFPPNKLPSPAQQADFEASQFHFLENPR